MLEPEFLDEDLEAHRAQAQIADNSLRIIGYMAAALILGFIAALPVVLRWFAS